MVLRCLFVVLCCLFVSLEACAGPLSKGSSEAREDEKAAEREMLQDEEMAAREMEEKVSGKIVSIDVTSQVMSVKEEDPYSEAGNIEEGSIYECFIRSDTDFVTAISLSDLAVGDRVTVDTYVIGGRRMADTVVLEERAYGKRSSKPKKKLPAVLVSD